MNTTQKMIAAVAIVAVLAVAAVGAGFAYTASTSNEGNSTTQVYFTLSQGETAANYSDSFDVDITYNSETAVVGGIEKPSEGIDEIKNAVAAVDSAKTTMGISAAALVEAVGADIPTTYSELTVNGLYAYGSTELAAMLTAIDSIEDSDKKTADTSKYNTYVTDAKAYVAAYNNASIKTTLAFNAVNKNGVAVAVAYFNGTTIDSEGAAKAAAVDTAATALATALNNATDAAVADYKNITADKIKAMTVAQYSALTTAIGNMEGEAKTAMQGLATAYDNAVTAFGTLEKYYLLSGTAAKAFTVGKSSDMTTMPQYNFKVSKIGEIDTTNYSYIMGVDFAGTDYEYKAFDGSQLSWTSGETGETAINLVFYMKDLKTAGPGEKPFTDLTFNFEVDSEVA